MPSPPRPLPQVRNFTSDRQAAQADQAREDLARSLGACPFLVGRLVSVRLGVTTPKTVTHGLGVPAAFIVVRQNYNGSGVAANIGLNGPTYQEAIDQRQQLSIYADIACDVDLWFYPRASKTIDVGLGQSK